MGIQNIRNGEATTELAGPGWGCVTARESHGCHISSRTGLSPHSHGRSQRGREGSPLQTEFQQVWEETDDSLDSGVPAIWAQTVPKLGAPTVSAGISSSLSNSRSFRLFNTAA